MPDPRKEEEEYGPPLPPKATRTWRMPEGEERPDRGASNVLEYIFGRNLSGGMGPDYSSLALDGMQLADDVTDPEVLKKFAETGQWHGIYGRADTTPIGEAAEAVVNDADWYDPKVHPQWHDAQNPLESLGDWAARRYYQKAEESDEAKRVRVGRTQVMPQGTPAPESYLEPQEDGTFLTR